MAIELTSKRYKAMQVVGIVGVVVGLGVSIAGGGVYAAIIMAVSLFLFLAGRFREWWQHG